MYSLDVGTIVATLVFLPTGKIPWGGKLQNVPPRRSVVSAGRRQSSDREQESLGTLD